MVVEWDDDKEREILERKKNLWVKTIDFLHITEFYFRKYVATKSETFLEMEIDEQRKLLEMIIIEGEDLIQSYIRAIDVLSEEVGDIETMVDKFKDLLKEE